MIHLAVTIKQTGLTGINDINHLREIFITIRKVEPAQTVNPNMAADQTRCTAAHEKHSSSQHRRVCRKRAERCPPAPKMPSGH